MSTRLHKHFTKEETDSLTEDYLKLTADELVEKYHRSYLAICGKAVRMGLARPEHLISRRKSALPMSYSEIGEKYLAGSTVKELANLCSCDARYIRDILNNKCDITILRAYRTHTLNEDYLEVIDSCDKAWVLGFSFADGDHNEQHRRLAWNLSAKDKQILTFIRKQFGSSAPIREYTGLHNNNSMINLSLFSKKLSQDAWKHGLIPKKSLVLEFPTTVPEEFIPAFIRGYFDGDGYVRCPELQTRSSHMTIVSTKPFLMGVVRELGIDTYDIREAAYKNGKTFILQYWGIDRLQKIYDYLYSDNGYRLKRKHDTFQKVLGFVKKDYTRVPTNEYFEADDKDGLVQQIFDKYRSKGFPHYNFTDEQRKRTFLKAYNNDYSTVDIQNHRKTFSAYLSGCLWHYFPHIWGTQTHGNKTALEVFNDDDSFKRLIHLRFQHAPQGITDSSVRVGFRLFPSCTVVTNFRPIIAANIYSNNCNDNAVVWDACAGFGARMMGAALSRKVKKYICNEPCKQTAEGLRRLHSDLQKFLNTDMELELYESGAEDFVLTEPIDFAFTCPPYFDLEKYSDEPTQSIVRFPNREDWFNLFLMPTVTTGLQAKKMVLVLGDSIAFPNLREKFEQTFSKDIIAKADYVTAAGPRHQNREVSETIFTLSYKEPQLALWNM